MITALVSSFFLGIILGAQSDAISKTAAEYLDHALDLMQQHALHRREIDWQGLRKAAAGYAPAAQTAEDTYPAIVYACSQLKEAVSTGRCNTI
jgi:hypothetical protein